MQRRLTTLVSSNDSRQQLKAEVWSRFWNWNLKLSSKIFVKLTKLWRCILVKNLRVCKLKFGWPFETAFLPRFWGLSLVNVCKLKLVRDVEDDFCQDLEAKIAQDFEIWWNWVQIWRGDITGTVTLVDESTESLRSVVPLVTFIKQSVVIIAFSEKAWSTTKYPGLWLPWSTMPSGQPKGH